MAGVPQSSRPTPGRLVRPQDSVVLGFLSRGVVELQFMDSVLKAYDFDQRQMKRFAPPWRISLQSSANVARGRNNLVREFLNLDHKPEWLWMVDDDMAFPAITLERLLQAADVQKTPELCAVGGLCFGYNSLSSVAPVAFQLDEFGAFEAWPQIPLNGDVVEVAGTGTACLLVHRTMLERIEAESPYMTGYPWFRDGECPVQINDTEVALQWVSEDLWFCAQVRANGGRVLIDTAVHIDHKKPIMLNYDLFQHGSLQRG